MEEIRPKGAPAGAPFGRISSKDPEACGWGTPLG
ncbi:hypothetical protein SCOCK_1140003 [Actinacidiphila cocklensis]|uniref:Uncharacterized protein n=1 Tax=Actinacidiphila cocklensis TaxID=887465 RepID=A0A9W4DPV8_9ACTN|nr:hypothetical protein SCOCK_1140003 [Actinacidiphila cocklensis]